mmetsp:Transcript_11538/g.12678  ORF Transcript_11538/g.12678 Transcript_11538/m.12678 type:complete len:195 (+) Transcript_11538:16-600(+)
MSKQHSPFFGGLGGPSGKGLTQGLDHPQVMTHPNMQHDYQSMSETKNPPLEFREYEKGRSIKLIGKFEGSKSSWRPYFDPFVSMTLDKRLTGKPHHVSAYHWLRMPLMTRIGWRVLHIKTMWFHYPAITYTLLLSLIGTALFPVYYFQRQKAFKQGKTAGVVTIGGGAPVGNGWRPEWNEPGGVTQPVWPPPAN